MKPIRIQRKRTKGWRMPENTVYVGRPSKWGNPHKIDGKNVFTPEHANMLFTFYLRDRKDDEKFWKSMKKLEGKNLACWCPLDQVCHADSLLKIVNNKV